MKIKKVVNVFGGPGVGKSYITSGLFKLMRMHKYNVELPYEFAKELTYEQQFNILQNDQPYIFIEQHRRLYRLIDKVEYVISDCPLLLTCVYFELKQGIYSFDPYINFVIDTFNKYPNLNILLKRNPKYEYDEVGRYQTYNEALNVDKSVVKWLNATTLNYTEIVSDKNTIDKIFEMVKEK